MFKTEGGGPAGAEKLLGVGILGGRFTTEPPKAAEKKNQWCILHAHSVGISNYLILRKKLENVPQVSSNLKPSAPVPEEGRMVFV